MDVAFGRRLSGDSDDAFQASDRQKGATTSCKSRPVGGVCGRERAAKHTLQDESGDLSVPAGRVDSKAPFFRTGESRSASRTGRSPKWRSASPTGRSLK